MGLSNALYGFFSGEYNLDQMYSTKWKEELHTPILDYYFKSVRVHWKLYFEMMRKNKRINS